MEIDENSTVRGVILESKPGIFPVFGAVPKKNLGLSHGTLLNPFSII